MRRADEMRLTNHNGIVRILIESILFLFCQQSPFQKLDGGKNYDWFAFVDMQ